MRSEVPHHEIVATLQQPKSFIFFSLLVFFFFNPPTVNAVYREKEFSTRIDGFHRSSFDGSHRGVVRLPYSESPIQIKTIDTSGVRDIPTYDGESSEWSTKSQSGGFLL